MPPGGASHPAGKKDPTGQTFAFEMGAAKQRGGQGWADVWYKGRFAWEMITTTVDLAQDWASVQVEHFTIYALLERAHSIVFLPLVARE